MRVVFIIYDPKYFARGLQIASIYTWIVEGLKNLLIQVDLVKYILLYFLNCGPLIAELLSIGIMNNCTTECKWGTNKC